MKMGLKLTLHANQKMLYKYVEGKEANGSIGTQFLFGFMFHAFAIP